MSDTIIAQLRTVIPGIVGAAIAWATANGIDIDPATEGALAAVLTDGTDEALYQFDQIHLTADGAAVGAAAIRPVLAPYLA